MGRRRRPVRLEQIETNMSWAPPGPSVYLEGAPTEEEAAAEGEAVRVKLANWTPPPEAWELLERLRSAVGKTVVIQQWDDVMAYPIGERPCLIRAHCRDVITRQDPAAPMAAYLVLEQVSLAEKPNSDLFDKRHSLLDGGEGRSLLSLAELAELTIEL